MYEAEKTVRRYERLYGQRILRPLVPELLRSAPPPQNGSVWLDWQAGSGVTTQELLHILPSDATVLASEEDRAALRVFHAHGELEKDRRCFARQDPPDALGLAAGTVDVALGHWRWQYLESPEHAIAEVCRVVRPGGTIALSFLVSQSGGSLLDAFRALGETTLADTISADGLTTQRVREILRSGNVAQIEVRQVQFQLPIGETSRPMMDPLLLDFLLPRWMGLVSGEEITSLTAPPFDLGSEPLVWDFRVGIAHAVMAE